SSRGGDDTTAADAPDHREARELRVIGTVVGGATGDVPRASATLGGPERRSGIDRSNARGLSLSPCSVSGWAAGELPDPAGGRHRRAAGGGQRHGRTGRDPHGRPRPVQPVSAGRGRRGGGRPRWGPGGRSAGAGTRWARGRSSWAPARR